MRMFYWRQLPRGILDFFLSYGNPDKAVPKHNKYLNNRKSYPTLDFPQWLCRWGGGHRFMPLPCSIKPLTRTIFDPTYLGVILSNHVFHISPTSLKSLIMGNYLDFGLKIAHRGNTQALTGAREICFVCLENEFVHYYCFFSVLGFWHKANFAHFKWFKQKNCSQIEKLTCNLLCSELISHTNEGDFFCFESCVLQGYP